MLKKFLSEFRDMWKILPHCQMEATAVIWAVPIWVAAPKFWRGAPKSGGTTASSLPHDGYGPSWGAERRVLGARAPTKFSEEILQWAGTHKVLAEKVRGNGNFR